jgi:hypothetical protein
MMSSLNDLGDDPEKFFRRSVFDVSSADLWRWCACREVMRETSRPAKGNSDGSG